MSNETGFISNQIEVRNLVKKYFSQPVLAGLSFMVEDGAFCVLVGANGVGKTTLLRILAGLVRPDQGDCLMGGIPLSDGPYLRRKIGYVGHQTMLYNDLSASENLRHFAALFQLPQADEKVADILQLVGLFPYQHKPVRIYSRGMQQRLSIARALLHDPDILLFDEPYTGLDQEAARFLDDRLQSLHQAGRTILIAAHRPQRLLPFASHFAWLREGKISHYLPVERLSEAPDFRDYLQEAA